jgi:hypothetical protein
MTKPATSFNIICMMAKATYELLNMLSTTKKRRGTPALAEIL